MESQDSIELSGKGAGTLFASITAAAAAIRGAAVEADSLEAEMYGSSARREAARTGKTSAPPGGAAFSWSLRRGAAKAGTLSFSAEPAPDGAFAAAGGSTFKEDGIMAQGRDGMFAPSAAVRAFVAEKLFGGTSGQADGGGPDDDAGACRTSLLSRIFLLIITSIPVAGFIWMCIRFKWI